MIKIFERSTTDFTTNGLGQIIPLKCVESKRKDFEGWELEVEVDLKNEHLIVKDRYILCETKEKGEQIFSINNIEVKRTVKFKAQHIAFSTVDFLLDDVRPTNLGCQSLMRYINERTDETSPFSMISNITDTSTIYFVRKTLFEALLETQERVGGAFDLDNFTISLNRNSTAYAHWDLKYGSNIESLVKYENWDNVITKIFPVGTDGVTLPEKYLHADVEYDKQYSRIISFDTQTADEDNNDISIENQIIELRELATNYLNDNKYPKLNYTVSSNVPQDLKIGEFVAVKHPIATFDTSIIAYTYDVLAKRVLSIEFGNYERSLKKQMDSIKDAIAKVEDKVKDNSSVLSKAKKEVYEIMNANGENGHIYFKCNENGVIQEIYAMDSDSLDTATNIMRLNANGLAGTNEGINGNYQSAILSNGQINANMLKVGTISDLLGRNTINLETGEIVLSAYATSSDLDDSKQAIESQIADVVSDMNNLQEQIDGEISSWFYDYSPTLTNIPASQWTTNDEKARHVGDTFTNTQEYISDTATPDAGKSWRFVVNDGVYSWTPIADSDAVKALQDASKAQSTADGKTTTYLTQPTKYSKGDTWILASNWNDYEKGQILVASATSNTFVASHWTDKTSYDTSSVVSSKISQSATDIKMEVSSNYTQKGKVSVGLSGETGNVTLTGNRLIVDSTNFKLDSNGNAVFSGDINTHKDVTIGQQLFFTRESKDARTEISFNPNHAGEECCMIGEYQDNTSILSTAANILNLYSVAGKTYHPDNAQSRVKIEENGVYFFLKKTNYDFCVNNKQVSYTFRNNSGDGNIWYNGFVADSQLQSITATPGQITTKQISFNTTYKTAPIVVVSARSLNPNTWIASVSNVTTTGATLALSSATASKAGTIYIDVMIMGVNA